MSRKSKMILCLLPVAVILFCWIQFRVLPGRAAEQAEYERSQKDAWTHDISVVEEFKSPYMGNASNTAGVFGVLPFHDLLAGFEMDSEDCALTVTYSGMVEKLGEETVRRNLVYNTAAAMAVIENLAEVSYCFGDGTFSFRREELEEALGRELSGLADDPGLWNEEVRGRLLGEEAVKKSTVRLNDLKLILC